MVSRGGEQVRPATGPDRVAYPAGTASVYPSGVSVASPFIERPQDPRPSTTEHSREQVKAINRACSHCAEGQQRRQARPESGRWSVESRAEPKRVQPGKRAPGQTAKSEFTWQREEQVDLLAAHFRSLTHTHPAHCTSTHAHTQSNIDALDSIRSTVHLIFYFAGYFQGWPMAISLAKYILILP